MLDKIILDYGVLSDALISKIIFEERGGRIGKVIITMTVSNYSNDYKYEIIQITFENVIKLRFVEIENVSNLVINAALLKELNGMITFDFFPENYSTGLIEDPNSDFEIKCTQVNYEVIEIL